MNFKLSDILKIVPGMARVQPRMLLMVGDEILRGLNAGEGSSGTRVRGAMSASALILSGWRCAAANDIAPPKE